jgi:2-methylcitrate dehydratase PrpD
MLNIVSALAGRIADSSWDTVNETMGDEGVRALVNWFGCALAGSGDVRPADLDAASPADTGRATRLGHGERSDILAAAMLCAAGAEALCYVDSHVPTMIGAGAVVGGALLPLAEDRAATGAGFIHAYLLGTEVACRTALALGAPADSGSFPTAACGLMGAAAAGAKLLGLAADATADALGMALAQAAALADAAEMSARDRLAGLAARDGLAAALRAERKRAQAPPRLDARSQESAFVHAPRPEAWLDGWGSDWQCARLGYHAYPCALFLHPLVEACLQLKREHHLTARQIGAVELRLHPAQAARSAAAQPLTRGEAGRSAWHAAAVALLDGKAGPARFDESRLDAARVRELRRRIALVPDPGLAETAARVRITLPDGSTLERTLRCALGHPLRPLSDRDLSDKFRRLAAETLATDQAERLLALVWNLRTLPDVGGLVRATVPEEVFEPAELPGSPLIPR